MKKYLIFYELEIKNKKLRTKRYEVVNKKSEALGQIFWSNVWRRYIFQGDIDFIFSSGCLKEVAAFIDRLMEERN